MVIQSSPTPKVQFQEFGEGGEVLTKCLIYSPRSVNLCYSDCSELPVLPIVCDLRIYCQLPVLSLSRIWFLPGLMSSDSKHVYICGKRLKGILMQVSVVSSLFSSLLSLTLHHKLLPLQQTQTVILVSSAFQITAICNVLQVNLPPQKKPKTKKQSQYRSLLICVPSVQDHSLGLAVV